MAPLLCWVDLFLGTGHGSTVPISVPCTLRATIESEEELWPNGSRLKQLAHWLSRHTRTGSRWSRATRRSSPCVSGPMRRRTRGSTTTWHGRVLFDSSYDTVVNANNDTLYSTTFADLRREPIVVSVPPTGDRYFVIQLVDMVDRQLRIHRDAGHGPRRRRLPARRAPLQGTRGRRGFHSGHPLPE